MSATKLPRQLTLRGGTSMCQGGSAKRSGRDRTLLDGARWIRIAGAWLQPPLLRHLGKLVGKPL